MNNNTIIDQDNKFYKTWTEDLGWKVSYRFAIPILTKKGYVGCKWQKSIEQMLKIEIEAEVLYQNKLDELEQKYTNKEVAQYTISKLHLTKLHTTCSKCGGEADILTFIMMVGTEMYPQAPIVCPYCANGDIIDNEVGTYYFKEMKFERETEEREFSRLQYIIKKEDLIGIK